MSQYKESYFFRNNHKMGKARVPTFYIVDTLKKISVHSTQSFITGSRCKQNAFSQVTFAINAFYD